MPTAAPTGAPAENVANARDRVREGGNACASMPSYIESGSVDEQRVRNEREEE